MLNNFSPGNHYKLFAQPELPACDAFRWLTLWVTYLETQHYGRPLDPEDYIFPTMGANGVVQPQEHVSHDTIQAWINEATTGAGIQKAGGGSFSTHCFRRGGAQYRFMYAPVGLRWSLSVVRWWGGWANGENVRCHLISNQCRSFINLPIPGLHSMTHLSDTYWMNYTPTRRTTATFSALSNAKLRARSSASTCWSDLCQQKRYDCCTLQSLPGSRICKMKWALSKPLSTRWSQRWPIL